MKIAERLRDERLPRNQVMPLRIEAADALDAAEKALAALDASWAVSWPDGPDHEYSGRPFHPADEDIALWRQHRLALDKLRGVQPNG
jgi:hypothetical protein